MVWRGGMARASVLIGLALLAVRGARADAILRVAEGDRAVYTNTPSAADAIPVVDGSAAPIVPLAGETAKERYDALIREAAREHGLPPALVRAVTEVESAFDPRAVSPKGAMGLMQLMPATAREYGVADAFDAAQNVRAGSRHLRSLIDQFGDQRLALAAYNAGAGAVRRHRGVPAYRETRDYVRKVEQVQQRLGETWSGGGALEPPARPVLLVRGGDGSVKLEN